MTKTFVNKFTPGTPQHVMAHALYQKSRGRRPSMGFRNIRNPIKALTAARAAAMFEIIADFDAFDTAEKVLGGRNPLSESAGLGLHMAYNHTKTELLRTAGDTTFSMKISDYLRIIREEGFILVLEEKFKEAGFGGVDSTEETLFIFFHPLDGVLLCFDTFDGDRVNGGNLYYNWTPNGTLQYSGCLSSGGWDEDCKMWSGHHDCREGIRRIMSNLRTQGKFVTPWVKDQFLWLLHHVDVKDPNYDYKEINSSRIARLPEYVQKAIRFGN